jgi:enoyl-[acyl-carrier protein] reductase III
MFTNFEKKQVALVTGGSRGIGRAVSVALAENYADTIFINYLQNDAAANATLEMIRSKGTKVHLIKTNLAFPDEIDRMFEEIYSKTSSIDIFIHCAALNTFKPLSKIKPNQWDLTMNISAKSFLYCTQKCLPIMKRGQIVAISSLGSRKFVPNYGAMGVSKSALESVVRYLAAELSSSGIRVNGVTAGFVDTDSIRKFPDYEAFVSDVISRTPAARIGKTEDVANAVLFLVSPLADWIYGQNIIVDGGISLY